MRSFFPAIFGIKSGVIPPPSTFPVNSANPTGNGLYFINNSYDNTYMNSDFSWSVWVKLSDTGSPQSVIRCSGPSTYPVDIGIVYNWTSLSPSFANKIVIGINNNGVETFDIDIPSITDGNWHNLIMTKEGTDIKLYHNLTEVISGTNSIGISTGTNIQFGPIHASLTENLQSPCSFYGVFNHAVDATDRVNIYNNGIPKCLDVLEQATKNKLRNYYNLSNWIGSTESETDDLIGSDNLTNIGSTPFTGTGLSVECST